MSLPMVAVVVGRDSSHLLDLAVVGAYSLRLALQVFYNLSYSLVNTALQVHWVGACGYVLKAFADDGLCEHGSGSGTVAGYVSSLGSYFLHHLSAHVFNWVFQLNFLGNGYTVLSDGRSAEFLLDDHVAALRAEGYFHGISQSVNATQHLSAGVGIKMKLFCHFIDLII